MNKPLEEKKSDGDPCWKGYKQVGMKKKGGKEVPNCVPEETIKESKTGYTATYQQSQFGGFRPILKNAQNKVAYAGGKSYKSAEDAAAEAQAYFDAYFAGNFNSDIGAMKAVRNFQTKMKSKMFKEGKDVEEELAANSVANNGIDFNKTGKYSSKSTYKDSQGIKPLKKWIEACNKAKDKSK